MWWFKAKGVTQNLKPRARRKFSVESLESRKMMAISAIYDGTTLKITGTGGDDGIYVSQHQVNNVSQVGIKDGQNQEVLITYGGSVKSIPALGLKYITIDGLGGNDNIYLNSEAISGYQPIIAQATIHGGQGNDVIVGTAVGDYIYGDAGDDVLWGSDGYDYIDGGVGNDQIVGGTGNDVLLGNADNDKIWGEAGDDALYGGTGDDYLCGNAGNDTFAQLEPGFDRYCDDFTPSLPIVHGLVATDVQQRELPLPAMLAALAEGAMRGFNFGTRIVYLGGTSYDVTLYENGSPVHQTVNFDSTYTDNDPSACNIAGQTDREFWTILMQRARLQYLGVDAPLYSQPLSEATLNVIDANTGHRLYSQSDALANYTGRGVTDYTIFTLPGPAAFQALMAAGHLFEAGTSKPATMPDSSIGFVPYHNYAIQGIFQDPNTKIWKIQLYNPWGRDGTNGAIEGANDGLFTVTWTAFQRNFTYFSVA